LHDAPPDACACGDYTAAGSFAPPPVAEVEDIQTGVPPLPADQAIAESPVAEPDAQVTSRRVFVIDNKEYPDPGPDVRHFA
jgi:hypothetical protein